MNPGMHRDSFPGSNPDFWQEPLRDTIPEMLGDIPRLMLPGVSPGSIAQCQGATDPDCIPEPIPEILPGFIPESLPETIPDTTPDVLPVFDKRNLWQYLSARNAPIASIV